LIVASPAPVLAQAAMPGGKPAVAATPAASGAVTPELGITPQDNVAVGSARVIPPDGTSYQDATAGGWFIARLEAGKSYVVEALASDNDGNTNQVVLALFESDGVTPWDTANFGTCGLEQMAPALQATGTGDGDRCAVAPALSNATSTRSLAFQVTGQTPYRVRVRETTVYSRWTVNGYNMFIPLHNTGAFTIRGVVLYYPESASADVGAADFVAFDNFALGARSSTQLVRNSGSLPPNRGTLRVLLVFASPPGGGTHLHMQTYAFNTAAGQYLFFAPEHINWQPNSW
jgi:hypothetical protein